MLTSFDDRLKGFEQSILPIHRSTQRMNTYYESTASEPTAFGQGADFLTWNQANAFRLCGMYRHLQNSGRGK
jgi:hypothetical protein